MRTFKYDLNRFAELKKTMLKGTIPIMLVALAAGLYVGLHGSQTETESVSRMPIVLPVTILVALIALALGLAQAVKRRRALYESYRLSIDENGITREQANTPTIRIMKSDITAITRNANKSFTLKGNSIRDVIGVGAQIENYDELEQVLRQIRPFGDGLQKPLLEKYGKLAGVGTVVLFLPVFLSNDRAVVTPCAVLLLGLLGWSFVETLRNRNVDARTKRSMYMVFFPVFGVLAKLAFIWL
jgi:hypothetical protein